MITEDKIKHLEFVQNIITRLSGNSFMIKGWSITIVLSGFGFFVSSRNVSLLILSAIGAFIFWILDAYYLWQEKVYRKLYQILIDKNKKKEYVLGNFDLDASSLISNETSYFKALFSTPLALIYISLIVLSVILFYLVSIKRG